MLIRNLDVMGGRVFPEMRLAASALWPHSSLVPGQVLAVRRTQFEHDAVLVG
jgi:hypothetical protein